jgi:uncharacterized RDD family membrane protein YckC
MLKCSHCQCENHDAAQFCANCGSRLTAADFTGAAPTADEARPGAQPAGAQQPEAGTVVAAEEKNAAAMRLVAEGKLAEALEALNEAIQMAPNHSPSYLNRADVLARLGMMTQAEADRRMASQLSGASRPPIESSATTTVGPSCGQSAPVSARFCPGCAQDLGGLVYMGFWIRFLAYIIDGVILLIPGIVLNLAVAAPASSVLGIAVGLAYFVGFWTAQGATLGQKAVGVRVTTVDGDPIDFGKAFLRYIGYWASWLTLGIGFLAIVWTPQKRGLHDYIAGTVVVKAR